jgi:spore coat protein U-like protein
MPQYSIGISSNITDNFYLESDILILQAITGLRISAVMGLTPDIVLRTTYSVPLQSLDFGITVLKAPSLLVNGIIRIQSLFGNSYSVNIESADIF